MSIAIVGSTIERESLFIEALRTVSIRYRYLFSPLYAQQKVKSPLFGVLVEFLTAHDAKKIVADYVIVYDSSLIPERESILSHFTGTLYDKPNKVSLACIYTPDNRLVNYRDAHPERFKNPNVQLKTLLGIESDFFSDYSYRRPSKNRRPERNKRMLNRVMNWMILNDNSLFKPVGKPYPDGPSQFHAPNMNFENAIDSKNRDTIHDCKNSTAVAASCSKDAANTASVAARKRAQSDLRIENVKKSKTVAKGEPKESTSNYKILNNTIMLDNYNEDTPEQRNSTAGSHKEPIEILSSDALSESGYSELSLDSPPNGDSSDEISDGSFKTASPPSPESNVMPSSTMFFDVETETSTEFPINNHHSSQGKSGGSIPEIPINDTNGEAMLVEQEISEVETDAQIVESMVSKSEMTQKLSDFQMELDKLHADFVKSISGS
ncbi:hypothetical protein K501DRAFT_67370 [Backusella circina FSU 941]|nr:hypothetical protein K501DRAFT_67370 [Backusella circina FSU 941]